MRGLTESQRHKQVNEPEANRTVKKIVGIALGLLILAVIWANYSESEHNTALQESSSSDKSPRQSQSVTTSQDAARGAGHEFAKRLITPALKSPSSADFPWETVTASKIEPLIDESGDSAARWRVRGAVDAQNSYGAQIRSWWVIEVLNSDGQWFPGRAEMDGEVVFELDGYSR